MIRSADNRALGGASRGLLVHATLCHERGGLGLRCCHTFSQPGEAALSYAVLREHARSWTFNDSAHSRPGRRDELNALDAGLNDDVALTMMTMMN